MEMGKSELRCTLSALWLGANVLLLLSCVTLGRITAVTLGMSAALLPVTVVGLAFGEALHHRVAEPPFRVFIYVVLLLSGAAVLLAG